MNKTQVMDLLKFNTNDRGVENWNKLDVSKNLKSFGVGLTVLRKLAKKIGRDHVLAAQLWKTKNYDAKIIAMLIEDPKKITREQAEKQVDELEGGYLAHVFSSCDASLGKAPFVVELADDWMKSNDTTRRNCGYGLLYEISKFKTKRAPDDAYFLEHIKHIGKVFEKENRPPCMGGALIGIGKRNPELNAAALKVAKSIGPIEHSNGTSEPLDLEKHLTSNYLKKKFSK